MKFIGRSILAVQLLFVFASSSAQNSQVLYFMNLPQNHLVNPALKPSNSLYIGFPGLTSVNVNITNNFFKFSDVFTKGMRISESTIPFLSPDFDRNKFLKGIKDRNYFEPQASVQLLGAGFSVGNDLYFFIDVTERAEANIVFPRDLVRLAFLGNEVFAGQTFDLKSAKADFNGYHEFGFGASEKITPKLRVGAKGKLLFGIAAGSFSSNTLDLTVNGDYTNTLNADMALNISAPIIFQIDSEHHIEDVKFNEARFDENGGWRQFIISTKNMGLGLDVGAVYEITNRIIVSAAITDFGFISWKSDLSNLSARSNIKLDGRDFVDIYDGNTTFADLAKGVIDSIGQSLIVSDSKASFTTRTPVGVSFGGQYLLNDKFSAGILSYSRIVGKQVKEALTLSGNMNLGSVFSASLAYTMCNHSYTNLGLGLAARAGFAQFYFLFDRIPLKWSKAGQSGDAVPLPANWNTINTRFGINLVFGNRVSKSKDTEK